MRELIDLLVRSGVPLLIVGGHAVGMHGAQRDTVDLDCLVATESRQTLTDFLKTRGFDEMATHGNFSRFRHRSLLYPLLDLMEVDPGVWTQMWNGSVEKTFAGLKVRVPSVGHCIAMKLHAIRQNPEREWKDGGDIVRLLRGHPSALTREKLGELCARYGLPEFAAEIWSRI